jgi:hypothetical protein
MKDLRFRTGTLWICVFEHALSADDNPSNRGTPEAKVRLDPLGAFGGAPSRTFRGF